MTDRLCTRLKLDHPIIQAPMAGGATTVALVAAASQAGVLGSLGAAYLSATQIEAAADAIRQQTDRPYAINLFASVAATPTVSTQPADAHAILDLITRYHAQLGLAPPTLPTSQPDPLAAQIDAVLRVRPAVFSFTFGRIDPAVLAQCRERGIMTIGTATTVREAQALVQDGVDAIVAQGAEAGGHRGTFLDDFNASLIGTLPLVPQIVDAVSVPVIAAGGIMDGRGIAAALVLGAQAAQMGTAFLSTDESGIHDAYKALLPASRAEQSRITRAFSGRPARGIENAFMRDADAIADELLPYPLQNALTRPLRNAGNHSGNLDILSLWAGQGAPLARRETVAQLVKRLAIELKAVQKHA